MRSVFYPIFQLHVTYCCIVWGCSKFSKKRLSVLQVKALRILYFKTCTAQTNPQFIESNGMKFVFVNNVSVCMCYCDMCCDVFVSLVMWIILYSFITDIIISWFINCLFTDLFILDITWICRSFFWKIVRLRYDWVD